MRSEIETTTHDTKCDLNLGIKEQFYARGTINIFVYVQFTLKDQLLQNHMQHFYFL